MADKADIGFMQQALALATKGRGMTYPNPLVGAVIVQRGRVIAQGYHKKVGGAHAEIVALQAAGKRAKGGTLYVTLEPCCHTGRTGPCTDAIIQAGLSRVVVASLDPDPRVNGQGIKQLRRAGIQVSLGPCRAQAIELNEAYFHHQKIGLPFVILKLAHTLDGCIATRDGDARWISGNSSREFVHRLRSEVGAVMVGGGTVRKDDPSLTVRLVKGISPFRVVVSASLDIPTTARLLSENLDRKTILASTEASIQRYAAQAGHRDLTYWTIQQGTDGLLDLRDLITKAGAFGMRSLLVEGGPQLATSLLRQGLVNKMISIIAPKIIGDGTHSFGSLGIERVADAIDFDNGTFVSCGDDVIFEGYPRGRR